MYGLSSMRDHFFLVITGWLIWPSLIFGEVHNEDAAAHFDHKIAPILAKHCLSCHNAAEQKGGLNLSELQAATKGGESGNPLKSTADAPAILWQRVLDGEMPPEGTVSQEEQATLKSWIDSGAAWGTNPIDAFQFTTEERAGRDWWSLQPLRQPTPPTIADHPIDGFIRSKLTDQHLQPSPPASARELARRIAFDITGLPPEPQDVAKLESSKDSSSYLELVRKLLDSPHYGEHWARHWLDVARYGESDGFEYDRMRPNAWRYRDWVINAFNQDMSYRKFAQLQIAGDILSPNDPAAITATGFLVCGAHDGLIPQGDVMRQVMRQDTLEDFVGTVGQTFLGLTINCARCHDHKFDPITQREYYEMTAALAGVNHGERKIQLNQDHLKRLQQQADQIRKSLAALERPIRSKLLAKRQGNQQTPNQKLSSNDNLRPIAAWDFTSGLHDQIGKLDAELVSGAKQTADGLELDGQAAHAVTQPLKNPLKAKTLEAWVRLANLDQRGGGVISLQTLDGVKFDAIVYGEREPHQWMAGSNGFQRTQSFKGEEERIATSEFVHIALTYHEDGRISAYRQGQPYGEPYQATGIASFAANQAQIIFGLRHGTAGSGRMLAGTIRQARLYDYVLNEVQIAASAGNTSYISRDEIIRQLNPKEQKTHRELSEQLANLTSEQAAMKEGKVYAAIARNPASIHVLLRGNPLQKGEVVAAGGIAAIQGVNADFGIGQTASDGERRKRLADWIANPNNPLFARVIVNRVWHYHFGRGFVDTPNDFGFSGGHPSHPELLDWLAGKLIEHDWSLKELHFLIVTSNTYQQSSRWNEAAAKIDSDNRWLWRFSPRRLSAEEIRDAVLTVSGGLNRQHGGPPFQDVRPYTHRGAQFYEPIDPAGNEFARRSIYRLWARGGRHPLLDAFDCPDPSATAPQRAMTTTPIQALTMLNSSFVMRLSESFSERLQSERETIPEQISLAYQDSFSRSPKGIELERASQFVQEHGLAAFCRVLLNSNEFMHID